MKLYVLIESLGDPGAYTEIVGVFSSLELAEQHQISYQYIKIVTLDDAEQAISSKLDYQQERKESSRLQRVRWQEVKNNQMRQIVESVASQSQHPVAARAQKIIDAAVDAGL